MAHHAMRSGSGEQIDRTSQDSNNNDDRGTTKRAEGDSLLVGVEAGAAGPGAGPGLVTGDGLAVGGWSDSKAGVIDDWHLLDVDGQSVVASSPSTSSHASPSASSSEQDEENVTVSDKLPVVHGQRLRARSQSQRRRLMSGGTGQKMSNEIAPTPSNRFKSERQGPMSPALIHLCTAIYSLMPGAALIAATMLAWLLFSKYWPITVAYYSYVLLDSRTCNRGGRRIEYIYNSKFWSYLAAYFPIKLKYSNRFNLDPNENYILNYHPHGISAFGCVSAFATNGLNFRNLFPGIKARFMVHETSFLVPIMRETFLFRGDCSVNSKSFDFILSKKWRNEGDAPGKAIRGASGKAGNLLALCGGGLAEADLSDAHRLYVKVATRKGFVKKALMHGANLIPCIAFGENSVFAKVNLEPSSFLGKLETKFYSLFRFKHPIYFGQSLLVGDKSIGCMPLKRPITVIMGDPIPVTRVESPSQEQIDQLHTAYITRLRSIYESNKDLCLEFDTSLEVV